MYGFDLMRLVIEVYGYDEIWNITVMKDEVDCFIKTVPV
jgi:hypothetical protein